MGKIFSQFSTTYMGAVYHGMKFDMIRNIIDALPGDTYILKMDTLPCGTIVRLEMVNSLFNDNTEIVSKYSVKRITLANGYTHAADFFDGIDIIDPPPVNIANPSITTNNYIPASSGTFTAPTMGNYKLAGSAGSNATNPSYNTGSGHYTLTLPAGLSIDTDKTIDNYKPEIGSNTCTCGAGSVGGAHSGWCDIGGLNP
jgi:hypothetical protein